MLFPKEGMLLLAELKANNNREWFKAKQASFDCHIKNPANLLALALASKLADHLHTHIEHKIFRLHRDVRFSKDKTPYNSHMRFGFWEHGMTAGKPMAGPAFYLSIEADGWVAGAGCMQFPPDALTRYRAKIAEPAASNSAAQMIAGLQNKGARFEAPALKRVPIGFDPAAKNADLLKHKGITCWFDHSFAELSDISAEDCMKAFTTVTPAYIFVRSLF